MAELTPKQIDETGFADLATTISTAAAAGGDQVRYSSGMFIAVNNGDASSHTLTVAAPVSTVGVQGYGDLPLSDITLVVAAGDIGVVRVPAKYQQNGFVNWTYDAVTSVTVDVLI
jgi:hypothetical protein